MAKRVVEEAVGSWNKRKYVENGEKNDRMCKSAMMLDGEISKYFDILQGVAQGCTLSPTLFKVIINDLILAIESAQQGVKVGGDMVSGLMFAGDFVGISGTAEGLQEQIEKALEYTRKWRVTANVDKCAVLVCHEDKKKASRVQMEVGRRGIAMIVDQYTYLGVEISENCS